MATIIDAQVGDVFQNIIGLHHPLYDKLITGWTRNRDFCAGQDDVKEKGTDYLKKLSGHTEKEYEAYLDRAQCPNFSGRTRTAYEGMLFRKDPVFTYSSKDQEVSAEIKQKANEYLSVVTNDGLSSQDFIQLVCKEVMTVNKAGVLVEFPYSDDDEILNQYQYELSGAKPLVGLYKAESIINWNTQTIGNVETLIYVVLKEEVYLNNEMGFIDNTPRYAYRILYLENWEDKSTRRYKQILMEPQTLTSAYGGAVSDSLSVTEVIYPMKNGEYLDYIPFFVYTSQGMLYNNKEHSLLHDLVNVNKGYYQNSANWENELYMVGAKTIAFPGWSDKNKNPRIGGAIAVPKDCIPTMIEASSSSGIKDEMQVKQNHMAILGSQNIAQEGRYFQSGETSRISAQAEDSILSTLAKKVSDICSRVFSLLFEWSGIPDFRGMSCRVAINTDFYEDNLSGEQLLSYIEAVQSGYYSYDAYYYAMEKREAFPPDWSIEKEKERIAATTGQDLTNTDMISSAVLLQRIEQLQQRLDEREGITQDTSEDTEENDNIEE